MGNLLAAAEVRKRDQLRAKEKMLAKEREAEGDEFADKEKFVTGAYKRQQEEMRRLEEEEARKEKDAEERKRREGGGMKALYKNLLDRDEQKHKEILKAVEEGKGKDGGGVIKEEQENAKSEVELAKEKGRWSTRRAKLLTNGSCSMQVSTLHQHQSRSRRQFTDPLGEMARQNLLGKGRRDCLRNNCLGRDQLMIAMMKMRGLQKAGSLKTSCWVSAVHNSDFLTSTKKPIRSLFRFRQVRIPIVHFTSSLFLRANLSYGFVLCYHSLHCRGQVTFARHPCRYIFRTPDFRAQIRTARRPFSSMAYVYQYFSPR